MVERDLGATVSFLIDGLGFQKFGEENGWQRYGAAVKGSPASMLICVPCPRRVAAPGGRARVHHLAWRMHDEAHQLEVREQVVARWRAADAGDRSLLV